MRLVISAKGRPSLIEIISPLGFGLDQMAIDAVSKWQFKPAEVNGNPVPVFAVVEVSFRLLGRNFDKEAEDRRRRYNLAVNELSMVPPRREAQNMEVMRTLIGEKYGPAYHFMSKLTQDPVESLALLHAAAKQDHGPALYDLSKRLIQGDGLPKDAERGVALLRKSAERGHTPAQFTAGLTFERGGSVPADEKLARQYFRYCAAKGEPQCQLHLGKLMLAMPKRRDSDYEQALAWLKLASMHDLAEARTLADEEWPKLTDAQRKSIEGLILRIGRK